MEKYCEITSKSLIDFEEIKFILANNDVNLVSSHEIEEKVFIKNEISLMNSNYQTIIDNSLILSKINDKRYLFSRNGKNHNKESTRIEVLSEKDCIEFLHHIGYKEGFSLESNVYVYSDGVNEISIINLINIGLYVSARKLNASVEELKNIIASFNIPFDEDACNESIERLYINKLRRQKR